jgi:flagellar motor switch protein FliN
MEVHETIPDAVEPLEAPPVELEAVLLEAVEAQATEAQAVEAQAIEAQAVEAQAIELPTVEAPAVEPQGIELPAANAVSYESLGAGTTNGAAGDLSLVLDVPVELAVEVGRTTMTIRETLAIMPGSIISLDRMAGEPVDLLVNGRRIARGEVVAVDEEFGLRITEVISDGRLGDH